MNGLASRCGAAFLVVAAVLAVASLIITNHIEEGETADFAILAAPTELSPCLQMSKQRLEFELKNTSGQDIFIVDVIKPCSCTSAALSSNFAKSGEFLTVSMEVDTGHARGLREYGVELVYCFHGQSQTARWSYPIKATLTVVPDYDVEMDTPQLSAVAGCDFTLTLTARASPSFKVLDVQSTLPCVQVRDVTEAVNGKQFLIRCTFNPTLFRPADGKCVLRIHTDSTREPTHYHEVQALNVQE
jgi:hypothetical protein